MAYSADDLTPLLARPTEQRGGLDFGQGVITSYDPLTAANTVAYRGAALSNLPVLNGSEAVLLTPGAVVGILRSNRSYFILGRITVPNTPEAATALDMVRIYTDTVANLDATTSPTYVDLATPGPIVSNVLVGKSGRALAFITAHMSSGFAGASSGGGEISIEVSGATSISPDLVERMRWTLSSNNAAQERIDAQFRVTALRVFDGDLNPGFNNFKMMYSRGNAGGNTASYFDRNLTVIPF